MMRVVPTRFLLLPWIVSFLFISGTDRQPSSGVSIVVSFIPTHPTKTMRTTTSRRTHQTSLSLRPHPSSCSSVVTQLASEEPTATTVENDDDASDQSPPPPPSTSILAELVEQSLTLPSKVRWKKKRHLMMEDVKSTIRKHPQKAPRKAEEMIHRMLRMSELYEEEKKQKRDGKDDECDTSNNFFHPTTECYNLWIHAIAKSGLDNAGQMAEEVMENHMKPHNVQPSGITYAAVIDAYANSNHQEPGSTSTKSSSGAILAEEFLYRILLSSSSSSSSSSSPQTTPASASIVLDSVSCDTIINAWAQQGTQESAERALSILYSIERFDAEVAKGLAKSTVDIHPTKYSYATVMSAFAKVGSTEAAEEASGLLKHMLMRLNDTNHKHSAVAPDTVVFNAAIHAWASSKDPRAGKRAMDLLEQMKALSSKYDTMPDLKTYNTVISAWAHSGDKNGAPQTERLVQEMQDIQNQRNKITSGAKNDDDRDGTNDSLVAADTVTYNSLLLAWSRSPLPGAAERVEKILEYMIKSGKNDIAPDTVSFSTVMDCVAKSKEPNKARRTRALLDRLEHLYRESGRRDLRSTTISYNTVLNACAFSALGTSEEERREAMTIAVRTFGSMDSSYPSRYSSKYAGVAPDTVTYGNMLKCIANLVPKGDVRNSMAITVFNKCCDDGLVGPLVWNEVRRAVPMKLLHDTLGLKRHVGSLQVNDLPTEWTVNNTSDKKKKEMMTNRRNKKHHQPSRHDKDKDEGKQGNKDQADKAFLVEPSYSNKDMIF